MILLLIFLLLISEFYHRSDRVRPLKKNCSHGGHCVFTKPYMLDVEDEKLKLVRVHYECIQCGIMGSRLVKFRNLYRKIITDTFPKEVIKNMFKGEVNGKGN